MRFVICSLSLCAMAAVSFAGTGPFQTDIFQTDSGVLKLTPLVHSSIVLEYQENIIHIDPYSKIDYSEQPDADLILMTHAHGDHCDPAAIKEITKDNTIFRYIGRVNAKFGTPVLAMIINGVWSIVLIILGTFNKLLFFTGILVWLFFALVVSGLFILRRKFPHIERPYKVWGYPLLPVIFVIICIGLCINSLIFYTIPSLIGLGLAATGIPIFIISSKKALKIERRT